MQPAYTEKLLSNLEHAEEFLLQGWAFEPKTPDVTVSVDIHINGRFIARVPAGTFRSDLKAAGFGTGYHAFFFNPQDYLAAPRNLIEVRESASSALLAAGSKVVATELAVNRDAFRRARVRSQAQWYEPGQEQQILRGEEPFLQRLETSVHFHPGLRILEVGSGAGNLLEYLRRRKRYFSSYWGLDLCRTKAEALHSRLAGPKIRFLTGDASTYPFPAQFDVVVASSVCESLFPSFLPMLQNVRRVLVPGGLLAFDLEIQDDRASISRAEWNGGRWRRLYSQLEIRRLLNEAGMELLDFSMYANSLTEHRMMVTALKLHPRPGQGSKNL